MKTWIFTLTTLFFALPIYAQFNLARGSSALMNNTSGIHNTAMGNQAMRSNTRGSFNAAFGASSLRLNTEGQSNTAFGYQSLYRNTTGKENTCLGANAMNTNSRGNYNTSVGTFSLAFSQSGNHNTALGHRALMSNTTGNSNIGVGGYALQSNEVGEYNTAVGYYALYMNTKGTLNTAIGNKSFTGGYAYNNSTALGSNSAISASNQIRLGDTEIKSIGGRVGWTTVSDQRFKNQIGENVPGLSFINKLRPVTYYLAGNDIRKFLGHTPLPLAQSKQLTSGFIAQEVEQAAKECAYDFSGVDSPKNEKDYYGLRYAEFTVPLVKAVQELSAENEALKERIKELEEKEETFEKMQADLEEIKALLNSSAKKD